MSLFPIDTTTFFIDFFLPFLAVFALFYVLLYKSKIFGDPTKSRTIKNLNIVFAIIVSILVVFYSPVKLGELIGKMFSGATVVIIGLTFFVAFVILISFAKGEEGGKKRSWGVLVIGAILALIALSISGVLPGQIGTDISLLPDFNTILFALIIIFTIVGLFYLLTKF